MQVLHKSKLNVRARTGRREAAGVLRAGRRIGLRDASRATPEHRNVNTRRPARAECIFVPVWQRKPRTRARRIVECTNVGVASALPAGGCAVRVAGGSGVLVPAGVGSALPSRTGSTCRPGSRAPAGLGRRRRGDFARRRGCEGRSVPVGGPVAPRDRASTSRWRHYELGRSETGAWALADFAPCKTCQRSAAPTRRVHISILHMLMCTWSPGGGAVCHVLHRPSRAGRGPGSW